MTRAEKHRVIADALRAQPDRSNRLIAMDADADHKTVARIRARLEEGGEILRYFKTVGKDGKEHPVLMSYWREHGEDGAVYEEDADTQLSR